MAISAKYGLWQWMHGSCFVISTWMNAVFSHTSSVGWGMVLLFRWLVQTEIFQHLLDGLSWNFVDKLMFHREWSFLILALEEFSSSFFIFMQDLAASYIHPSIHPFSATSKSRWQQAKQGCPDISSNVFKLLMGDSDVYPGQMRYKTVVSYQLDRPGKPPKESTQEASWSDASSTGCFRHKEEAALLRAPSRCVSASRGTNFGRFCDLILLVTTQSSWL